MLLFISLRLQLNYFCQGTQAKELCLAFFFHHILVFVSSFKLNVKYCMCPYVGFPSVRWHNKRHFKRGKGVRALTFLPTRKFQA